MRSARRRRRTCGSPKPGLLGPCFCNLALRPQSWCCLQSWVRHESKLAAGSQTLQTPSHAHVPQSQLNQLHSFPCGLAPSAAPVHQAQLLPARGILQQTSRRARGWGPATQQARQAGSSHMPKPAPPPPARPHVRRRTPPLWRCAYPAGPSLTVCHPNRRPDS